MRLTQSTDHPYKSILADSFVTHIATNTDSSTDSNTDSDAETMPNGISEVNILGKPQILIDGQEIELRSQRSIALIAYLSLELSPTPRKQIADLLWPAEEQPTNDRLRVLLSKLRRTAPNLVNSTKQSLHIDKSIQQNTDAIRFLALHDQNTTEAYKKAIESYTGDFLSGLELEASREFDRWILHQQTIWREVLNFMYHDVIEKLLTDGTSENDLREALFLAHKHTSIFPWSDEMIFKLALIYIKKRQPDRALAMLNRYQTRIAKEFEVDLPPELHVIWQHLSNAEVALIVKAFPTYF